VATASDRSGPIGEEVVLYLIWPLALATVVVGVWLVRHPVALVTVNIGVATWWLFGAGGALAAGLVLWTMWWVRELRWP
jgi:hypothetical protein